MIHLENIHFGYRKGQELFHALDLHIEKGHLYGLLGKNGAGKTTLLKII
jgi:ABC-2 type transport system ATP-binding protein